MRLYKSVSFVVQAIAFRQTVTYIARQNDLLRVVSADERAIVETFLSLKNGGTVEFDLMSETLFGQRILLPGRRKYTKRAYQIRVKEHR